MMWLAIVQRPILPMIIAQQGKAHLAGWLLLIPVLLVILAAACFLVRYRGYAPTLIALAVAGALTLGGHGLARLSDNLESNDTLGGVMLIGATVLLLASAVVIEWMYRLRRDG